MDLSAILLLTSVTVMVIWYVARPFFEHWRIQADSDQAGSSLLAEREGVLNALQELDSDHGLGKIPEDEYTLQRAALLQKGAEVLRRLDALESLPANPKAVPEDGKPASASRVARRLSDDELEDLISRRRSARHEKSAGFCPSCGKPVLQSDRFCPSCGNVLE